MTAIVTNLVPAENLVYNAVQTFQFLLFSRVEIIMQF